MLADENVVSVSNTNILPQAEHFDKVSTVTEKFEKFVRLFKLQDHREPIYIKQLEANLSSQRFFLEIDISHMKDFGDEGLRAGGASPADLFQEFVQNPMQYLLNFERKVADIAKDLSLFTADPVAAVHIILAWGDCAPTRIREIASNTVARVICIPGIAIHTSPIRPRLTHASLRCRSCGDTWDMQVFENEFALPRKCKTSEDSGVGTKCMNNPYEIIPHLSQFSDQQTIKVQEIPEDVPTGELPQYKSVVVDRYLVDRIKPGKRVIVIGVMFVKGGSAERNSTVRQTFLRGLGVWVQDEGNEELGQLSRVWSLSEKAEFQNIARKPDLYDVIGRSIDPAIFGMEDVKKAIACQLFGGTRKKHSDGSALRGDINILLVGDPSAGKSQLLKFAKIVSPIAVYTSGKGSSAAGLTAAIQREAGGDVYLEPGAFVLADGGIVCIDEFDKMDNYDRVAIHEAMEQQTISIAKAGITTTVNARVAVLAAANPRFGTYDSALPNEEQFDFQTTLLNRFDLVFKIIDHRDSERDRLLARHVVNQFKHQTSGPQHSGTSKLQRERVQGRQATSDILDTQQLKAYISYARESCRPTLDQQARQYLADFYVKVREKAFGYEAEAQQTKTRTEAYEEEKKKQQPPAAAGAPQAAAAGEEQGKRSYKPSGGKGHISVTIRQLEAVIRITEALAKMELRTSATLKDAKEAVRIFEVATMETLQSSELQMDPKTAENVGKVEDQVRRILPPGQVGKYMQLFDHFRKMGYEDRVITKAFEVMRRRDELEFLYHCKQVKRIG